MSASIHTDNLKLLVALAATDEAPGQVNLDPQAPNPYTLNA